jgi:ornithine racemase
MLHISVIHAWIKFMARLVVDREKISGNYEQVLNRCNCAEVSLLTVFKEGIVRKRLLDHFFQMGLTRLGLAHYPAFSHSIPDGVEKVLLYLTPWSDLDAVVSSYDISLQSDPDTLNLLAGAAVRAGKRHKVLLVAEVGDEREGSPIEEMYSLALLIKKHHSASLDLAGIAANFACLSDCLPDSEIFTRLASCKNELMSCFHQDVPILSVGGSDVLQWLDQGNNLPPEVTEIRCGTAVHLGTYPYSDTPIAGANTDAIVLETEVLEFRKKHGRLRAVMDFGMLDTSPQDVKPPFEGMVFKGASSGYSVFDVTNCPERISTGRHIVFSLNHRSLSRAFLSPKLSLKIQG